MLFGSVAVGTGGFAKLIDAISINASAAYSVGDTIYYGTYPQTDVTASLGSVLNSQSGTWKSYGYYSGTGTWDDGQMTSSDYMRYKDITYKGEKYRGVKFDSYRPHYTGSISSVSITYQDDNGYTTGNVYWFKYEPLKWRVLDPDSGFIVCASAIDSQAYNNYILYADGEIYGNAEKTYRANDYANSSIREWLNNDFMNTAFSSSQQENIKVTELDNSCPYDSAYNSANTSDKIFLLSYNEVTNSAYGFNSSASEQDTARVMASSDYAKCQGIYKNSVGNSYWWLRSPGSNSDGACGVDGIGGADVDDFVNLTCYGVVPALKLQNLKSVYAGSEIEDTFSAKLNAKSSTTVDYRSKVNITATASGVPDGYFLAIYSGNTLLEKGTKDKVSYTPKDSNNKPAELKSDITYTVKVVDGKNAVQKDSDGKDLTANIEIKVKQGFFDKLIAFFKGLFGLLPTVEIKP